MSRQKLGRKKLHISLDSYASELLQELGETEQDTYSAIICKAIRKYARASAYPSDDTIKGYVLQALKGYDPELVSKVMGGLCWALETMAPKEAEEVWENY